MKIAAVVHNSVRRDARVIKEAVSLDRAGHSVTIHGISETDSSETFTLPGSAVTVKLSPRLVPEPATGSNLLANAWIRRPLFGGLFALLLVGLVVFANPLTRLLSMHPDGTLNTSHHLTSQLLLMSNLMLLALLFRRTFHRRVLKPLVCGMRWATGKGRLQFCHFVVRRYPQSAVATHYAVQCQRQNFARIMPPLLASLLQDGRPDAVHLHDIAALLLADDIKERFNCPIIWDAHEIYEDMAGANDLRGLLNGGVIRAQAKFVDRLITINDSIQNYYASNHKALPPAVVLMNATDRVSPPVYDGRLHRAAGLPSEQRILLFQGGFGAKRGLRMLVEASHDFAPDWTLVLMGWGIMEADLRALAQMKQRQGAVANTVFLPGVPHRELQEWSAGASLGAITYENTSLNHLYCTPNKLWEYPSAGVPILATDLEEMGKAVRTHTIGFLLPRNFTALDIAGAVNCVTREDLSRARKACQTYMESSNWGVYEPRLQNLYAELDLQCRSRRPSPVSAPAQAAKSWNDAKSPELIAQLQ